MIAVLVLSAAGIGITLAADDSGQPMDTLSSYLHARRLPLVEARLITKSDGDRKLLLYGFVATEFGKADAEEQARDFMDDPDIEIDDRIRVRPELLTLGNDSNAGTAAAVSNPEQDGQDAGSQDATGQSAQQQADQTESFPDAIGDRDAYMNQANDDELLTNSGLGAGIPLSLAIIGSGFVVPPFGAPIIAPPIYYNHLPPVIIRPPVAYSPPPIIVMRPVSGPPTVFRGFPSPFTAAPFPAGPAPMFPATGGAPPLATTINPAFGGFHPAFGGFQGGFGGGFGMHSGGFGGHR